MDLNLKNEILQLIQKVPFESNVDIRAFFLKLKENVKYSLSGRQVVIEETSESINITGTNITRWYR